MCTENIKVEKYSLKTTWTLICETTLLNYVNRLSYRQKFSNFILIYYSLILIITYLTPNFFDFYNSNLSGYFNIV